MDELNEVLKGVEVLEAQGQIEDAIRMLEKLCMLFPESEIGFRLEIGKMWYRNGNRQQALAVFIDIYHVEKREDIKQFILEVYTSKERDEAAKKQYKANLEVLRAYPHYYGCKLIEAPTVEIIYSTESEIVYYSEETQEFYWDIRNPEDVFIPENTGVMLVDCIWEETIYQRIGHIKDSWKTVGHENGLYLTFLDSAKWQVFLLTVDIEKILKTRKTALFNGEEGYKEYLSNPYHAPAGIMIAQREICDRLKEMVRQRTLALGADWQETVEYYQNAKDKIREKLKQGTPRILFIATRYSTATQYHIRDCAAASQRLGWETKVAIEKDEFEVSSELSLRSELISFRPDVVFSINTFRKNLSEAALDGLVWITWFQDLLPSTTGDSSITEHLGSRDIFISPFFNDLKGRRWGQDYKRMWPAPLSCNPEIYRPYTLSPEEMAKYNCNVCYVANGTDYRKERDKFCESFPKGLQESFMIATDVFFEYQKMGDAYAGAVEIAAILREILNGIGVEWDDGLLERTSVFLTTGAAYRHEKFLVAEALIDAGITNLKLYGNEWEDDERTAPYAMGVIQNGAEMSKAIQAADITIGTHPEFSLSARVVEAIASGAFCLVNDIPVGDMANAREFFKEGEDIIYYYGREDMVAKVKFYLENREERRRIAENGRKVIKKKLTHEVMMQNTIKNAIKQIEEMEDTRC